MSMKVKLNIEGFNQLRKSPEVVGVVKREAERICSAANSFADADGYEVGIWTGETRTIATVITGDVHTINSNAQHNTLLKVLQG